MSLLRTLLGWWRRPRTGGAARLVAARGSIDEALAARRARRAAYSERARKAAATRFRNRMDAARGRFETPTTSTEGTTT